MSDLLDITFARAGALWLLLILPVMAFVAWKYTPRRDNRKRALAGLRALGIFAIILAMSEPLIASTASGTSVVFVVDRSGSIPPATGDELARFVNDSLAGAPGGSEAAVVAFGANPDVVAAPIVTTLDEHLPRTG